MSTSIELSGRRVGRLKAGWILFKAAWRYLQSDKEIVLIPLITTVLNLLLFGVVMTAFFFLVLNGALAFSAEGEPITASEYLFFFCLYVISAFTLALSQAGVANTVYVRAHGGNATLGDSLTVAFSHSVSLFLWAVITSTVGLLLRMVAERSQLLGRIVTSVLGVTWSIMTYFVIPSIVLGKKSAPAAIGHSAQLFKRTWGEAIVSNISMGIVFLVIYLFVFVAFGGLLILSIGTQSGLVLILFFIFFVAAIIAISLLQSALGGIVKTLLYIYASEGTVPPNFDPELLQKMLQRKDGQVVIPQPLVQTNNF